MVEVVYDRYDEIWAISEFAATPFRKMFPNGFGWCQTYCRLRITRFA